MKLFGEIAGRGCASWFEDGAIGKRRGTFAVTAFADGGTTPVLGTTVAREGLAFVSPARIAEGELRVRFTLGGRAIEARVLVGRSEPIFPGATLLCRSIASFTAIADADWDAVVRYVDSVPEATPVDADAAAVDGAGDDFRSLPPATQHAIVAMLVEAGRLAPPEPGREPLLRASCGTVRRLGDGRLAREVAISSRTTLDEYETRFRLYSGGAVDLIP